MLATLKEHPGRDETNIAESKTIFFTSATTTADGSQDVKLFAECNSTSSWREIYEKQSFIMQIKLAQKESCARLGRAKNFASGKIIFCFSIRRDLEKMEK